MSFFTATRARRRASVIGLGALGAAVMFGSGALVARAVDREDGGSSPAANMIPIGNVSRDDGAAGTTAPAAAFPGPSKQETAAADSAAGRGGAMIYPSGCPAPLGDVISGGAIDPAKSGFAMNLPGAGYTLTGINLHATGACDKDGNASSGTLTLDTTWKHAESGLDVYISQAKSAERASNVRWESSATFSSNGYTYAVSVNGDRAYPAATGGGTTTAAQDAPASGSGAGTAGSPAIAPGEPYPGGIDPRASAVLDDLIAKLVPELAGGQCFYVEAQGSWADLVAAGIGDPRGAIPAGYAESWANFRVFTAPAGCNAGPVPAQGGYEATFERTGSDYGGISISVYPLGDGAVPYPGNLNEYGANWSNGAWQFNVGAKSERGASAEVVRAIAQALDPGFANACLATNVPIGEADLAALGLKAPAAPSGYTAQPGPATKAELTGSCTPEQRAQFQGNEQASWTLTGPGSASIEVRAYRYATAEPGGSGYISEGNLGWQGPNGWRIEIYGYNRENGTPVDRETLVAVAKSIDPTLDVAKLQDGGGAKPLPVEERSAR